MDPPAGSLRIAVIPSIFDPRLSYLENVLTGALYRQGHEVRVFTSGYGSKYEPLAPEIDATVPFPVYRSNRIFRVKGTQFPYDTRVAGLLSDFDPQIAFVLAPLHGIGHAWLKFLPKTCKVASSFSDLPWHRSTRPLGTLVKKRWARRVFTRSSAVLTATPETRELLESWAGGRLEGKMCHTGLLLDLSKEPDVRHLPEEVATLRTRVRKLGALITRITSEKAIPDFFSQIEEVLLKSPDTGFVFGGLDSGPASAALRERVECSQTAARCVLLPMLDEGAIRSVFAAADFSVWNSVSIGIYHALASGCPAVLWSGQVSRHLVKDGENGFWFADRDKAAETISRAMSHPWDREEIRRSVEGADVNRVAAALVSALMTQGAK